MFQSDKLEIWRLAVCRLEVHIIFWQNTPCGYGFCRYTICTSHLTRSVQYRCLQPLSHLSVTAPLAQGSLSVHANFAQGEGECFLFLVSEFSSKQALHRALQIKDLQLTRLAVSPLSQKGTLTLPPFWEPCMLHCLFERARIKNTYTSRQTLINQIPIYCRHARLIKESCTLCNCLYSIIRNLPHLPKKGEILFLFRCPSPTVTLLR